MADKFSDAGLLELLVRYSDVYETLTVIASDVSKTFFARPRPDPARPRPHLPRPRPDLLRPRPRT